LCVIYLADGNVCPALESGRTLGSAPTGKNSRRKLESLRHKKRDVRKMPGKTLVLIVLLWALAGPWASAAQNPETAYMIYVSPNGNDRWTGRLAEPARDKSDGPVASLAGARDAIRMLRIKEGPAGLPIRVIIFDGEYAIGETVDFKPADSGTESFPVTFEAAAGAKPVFHGGQAITKWNRSAEVWTANVPGAREGKRRFNQLFVNGVRYTRARQPNRGKLWSRFESVKQTREELTAGFKADDIKPWRSADKVLAVFLRIYDISLFPVESIDPAARALRLKLDPQKPSLAHLNEDRRYFLENSLSFLDEAGEWFLDGNTGTLHVRPLPEHKTGEFRAIAPAVDRLISFDGEPGKPVHHIIFRGLAFKYSEWTLPAEGYYDGHQADYEIGAAIQADYAESLRFENCLFQSLGRYGLWLRRACRNNLVTSCEFSHLAGGGVIVGENRKGIAPAEETFGNTVTLSEVHHCGEVWYGSVGALIGFAGRNRLADNRIHHLPYSGISVGWGWEDKPNPAHHNVVERNRVYEAMLLMSDGAGIYTLGLQPGTIIRNNIIHDVHGRMPGGNGIYLDEGSAEIVVENNLVARVQGTAMVFHMANRNICRNNIFALAALNTYHASGAKDNRAECNIVYFSEGRVLPLRNWSKGAVAMDNNLYYSTTGNGLEFERGASLDPWRKSGQDTHSIAADPMFADPAGGDFSLREDSPAFKLGFKTFEIPAIGAPAGGSRLEK